jgi:hypothetical protein
MSVVDATNLSQAIGSPVVHDVWGIGHDDVLLFASMTYDMRVCARILDTMPCWANAANVIPSSSCTYVVSQFSADATKYCMLSRRFWVIVVALLESILVCQSSPWLQEMTEWTKMIIMMTTWATTEHTIL